VGKNGKNVVNAELSITEDTDFLLPFTTYFVVSGMMIAAISVNYFGSRYVKQHLR
jgi:hypothetical protein